MKRNITTQIVIVPYVSIMASHSMQLGKGQVSHECVTTSNLQDFIESINGEARTEVVLILVDAFCKEKFQTWLKKMVCIKKENNGKRKKEQLSLNVEKDVSLINITNLMKHHYHNNSI